jgi:RNA polymerase subunit RPABC4/transcription elongation factor Spt4
MTTRHILLALVLLFIGLAIACPAASGQLSTLPKYDPVMTLDPAKPGPGDNVRVTTHVSFFYYMQGKDPSVPDVYVRYSLIGPSGEEALSSSTEGYTNAQELQYADIKIPSKSGDYTLNVYVYDVPGGDIYGQGAVQFTIKAAATTPIPVVSTPTPTEVVTPVTVVPTIAPPVQSGFNFNSQLLLIVGAIIVVAVLFAILVLAVLAFLWTRRKLVIAPSVASAPGDGQSAIPVQVRFKNGLGMAKKMKEDTTVEMSATAGSIGNAVIAKGSDLAEASLRTSKEFGPVTITAKAGNKAATAKVHFTSDNAKLGITLAPEALPADGSSTSTVIIRVMDANGSAIAPMEDLAIDLKATLGTIASKVTIPAKAIEVSTPFTAGTVPGKAVVTAAAGSLKGEATLVVHEKPGRYCMHCGAPMKMEEPSCPRCGLTPPSGVDTKQCPACGTVIPEAAKFCHKCGVVQPVQAKAVDPNAVKK